MCGAGPAASAAAGQDAATAELLVGLGAPAPNLVQPMAPANPGAACAATAALWTGAMYGAHPDAAGLVAALGTPAPGRAQDAAPEPPGTEDVANSALWNDALCCAHPGATTGGLLTALGALATGGAQHAVPELPTTACEPSAALCNGAWCADGPSATDSPFEQGRLTPGSDCWDGWDASTSNKSASKTSLPVAHVFEPTDHSDPRMLRTCSPKNCFDRPLKGVGAEDADARATKALPAGSYPSRICPVLLARMSLISSSEQPLCIKKNLTSKDASCDRPSGRRRRPGSNTTSGIAFFSGATARCPSALAGSPPQRRFCGGVSSTAGALCHMQSIMCHSEATSTWVKQASLS
mmetsp:Transcript_13346/g.47113  ORF Transcript_13346/g.47113 Transcript_13346/m.47113 type:complete len:351 (+) Transcript_13346:399-1451(+)